MGHKSKGKNQRSAAYSTDHDNKVSKMFIISGLGMISIHVEWLQISYTH